MAAPNQPQPLTDHHTSLSRAVRAVFSVTLLSRVGGLVREVIVARIFGDTAIGSAFAAAFAIPNLFRRLFGEGALSAAFIPEYTRHVRDQPEQAHRLASLTLITLGLATGVLTVVVELLLLGLLVLLPHDAERALSLRLIMVMLPFMPFICIVAILAGMLQVHGRFAASATGPLVLNGFIIAFGLYFLLTNQVAQERPAYIIGAATVLSGLTQAMWFAVLLRPHVRWTREVRPALGSGRVMLNRFVPVLIGLGTLQLSAFIDTAITMYPLWFGPQFLGRAYPLDEKSAVILSAMQRLYQFPLGVFGIAVATAVFPLLARAAGDAEAFGSTLRRGMRLSLFIGLPASVGLVLVRHDLVAVLFGAGTNAAGKTGFSQEGVARSTLVLLGYAPAVWAYSLNHVLTRAFYALGDTRTPMRVSVGMVFVNLTLNCTLIWFLREAGLAWGTSICAIAQCTILAALLHRRGHAPVDRAAWAGALRILLATVVLVAVCALVLWALPEPQTWWQRAVRLAAATSAGVAGFTVGALLLRVPELRWLTRSG
ncbi:MAG: murein biosynthesis integral membrane protein MurJ [Phycisphaerales bacterium]